MTSRAPFLGASLLALLAATIFSHSSEAAPPFLATTGGAAQPVPSDKLTVVADRDDDDADGKPDAEQDYLPPQARADLAPLDARFVGARLEAVAGAGSARIVANGRPIAWGERVPAGAYVQGIAPGRVALVARGQNDLQLAIDVHGVGMRDGAKNPVDMTHEHASIERTPPTRVDLDDADTTVDDPDALRVVVSSPQGSSLGPIAIESVGADGNTLDSLRDVRLGLVDCEGMTCKASAPIRFVVDDVDRQHTLVSSRSVRAEVGGGIVVRDASGKKLQAIRVAGPRHTTGNGPALGRTRMTIRPVVMRLSPGGAPAVGGNDAGALASIRQELALASATWGQCGITFGPAQQMDAKLVSPPPPYLVSIGDDVGLPASGGEIKMKVDGKALSFATKKGWSTRQAALELQKVAQKSGFSATLSENARIAPGAAPSVDVSMKGLTGQLANVEVVSSSDATLAVVVGSVDLTDGLQHFGDTDSVAGTLEERTLVKAVEDGDPRTIEVIVVPFFAGGGRIGESFIASDGSSMRNVVIIDRAGVRARRTSLTLAHELGHVILDEPGHPDDYGVDTPTLLMDSDASDSSPFGPRRLTVDECTRASRQSGPAARVPLLTEWKLGPLKYAQTSYAR